MGHSRVVGDRRHIPVAIKVLRYPLDELDPVMIEDFRREVRFCRSIRNPHVIGFFGAGVLRRTDQAYLVTELMARGSLKAILRDTTIALEWDRRVQFVSDAATGMRCGPATQVRAVLRALVR